MRRLFTRVLAATALFAMPAAAMAAGTYTSVQSGGAGPTQQYIQGTTVVQMQVAQSCSELDTTDAVFPNAEDTYANAPGTPQTQTFTVTTHCNYNTGAYLLFDSSQNCAMNGPGAAIPYTITYTGSSADSRSTGTQYCYDNNDGAAGPFEFPLGQGDGSSPAFQFTATATPAANNTPGTYSDTLAVYLEF